mgnify:FL=1
MSCTFTKAERICLQKEIDELFTPGNAKGATVFPLRMVFRYVNREDPEEPAVKVLISVAKKRLHRAVDRVRAKRQIREAYRLSKPLGKRAANIAFVWLADKPQESATVREAVVRRLEKL